MITITMTSNGDSNISSDSNGNGRGTGNGDGSCKGNVKGNGIGIGSGSGNTTLNAAATAAANVDPDDDPLSPLRGEEPPAFWNDRREEAPRRAAQGVSPEDASVELDSDQFFVRSVSLPRYWHSFAQPLFKFLEAFS